MEKGKLKKGIESESNISKKEEFEVLTLLLKQFINYEYDFESTIAGFDVRRGIGIIKNAMCLEYGKLWTEL